MAGATRLQSILKMEYGINEAVCAPVRGGWTSLAFRVDSPEGAFFLKAYEKRRAAAVRWARELETYLPVVAALGRGVLAGRAVEPVRTRSGGWFCEDAECIYALFGFIEGRIVGEGPLSPEQARQLGAALAVLHAWRGDEALLARLPCEDYSLPFYGDLKRVLAAPSKSKAKAELQSLLAPAAGPALARLAACLDMAAELKGTTPPLVPGHTDLHGGNLMETENGLMILDWEGLKMVPAEADLFMLSGIPGGGKAVEAYLELRPDFEPLPLALKFYALRRNLEDIWEFIEQLTIDAPDSDSRRCALKHLSALLQPFG